jgi:hypothetical protein
MRRLVFGAILVTEMIGALFALPDIRGPQVIDIAWALLRFCEI